MIFPTPQEFENAVVMALMMCKNYVLVPWISSIWMVLNKIPRALVSIAIPWSRTQQKPKIESIYQPPPAACCAWKKRCAYL